MPRYVAPPDLAGVLECLAADPDQTHVLVGGTDLLNAMRHGRITPLTLVDIKAANDLPTPLEISDDGVSIGPTLTMAELAAHQTMQAWYPALTDAADVVGSVAIRNRASLIGNVCNASPAADTAPALLVYGAEAVILGPGGTQQVVPLSEFFHGPRATACGPGHLMVGIKIPAPANGLGSAFRRLTRRRGVDLASVSVAAGVDLGNDIRLGLGAVGPKPLLSATVRGVKIEDPQALEMALEELLELATPIADVRSGQGYRVATLRVLARRAIRAAQSRRPEGQAI